MDPVRACNLAVRSGGQNDTCVQVTRTSAQILWGDTVLEGPDAIPRWLYKCRQLLGYSMREFVTATRAWDAYIIGTISMAQLMNFLPVHLRDNDAAREMHR